MQFASVIAFSVFSASAVMAQTTVAAISQIGDGQIQATTATHGNATTIATQTENGAAQLGNGVVAAAGLVAAGAFLI